MDLNRIGISTSDAGSKFFRVGDRRTKTLVGCSRVSSVPFAYSNRFSNQFGNSYGSAKLLTSFENGASAWHSNDDALIASNK